MESVQLSVVGPPSERGPVTAGVPWPRGALPDTERLTLWDVHDRPIILQSRVLDRWPDGSARWVLLDWSAIAGCGPYTLTTEEPLPSYDSARVRVEENGDHLTLDTVVARFEIGPGELFPFRAVSVGGASTIDPDRTYFRVEDEHGGVFTPFAEDIAV